MRRLVPALPLLLAAACAHPAPDAATNRVTLQRRDALPPLARSALKKPMARHGKDLEALLTAALSLDHAQTARVAARVAAEPRIARPGDALDSVNAVFPESFFQLQDTFHERTLALGQAARAADDAAVADAFGRLTETCIACHAVYLRMGSDDVEDGARRGRRAPARTHR
jgi:cytochrome c556